MQMVKRISLVSCFLAVLCAGISVLDSGRRATSPRAVDSSRVAVVRKPVAPTAATPERPVASPASCPEGPAPRAEDTVAGECAAASDPIGARREDATRAGLVLPNEEERKTLAESFAREYWGEGLRLVEAECQLGPGKAPYSHLYVFCKGDGGWNREAVLAELAAGADPIGWDDQVYCLEMGARTDQPPVICRWNGLPPEILKHSEAIAALQARFGVRDYRLSRRHVSAAFPVLEFSSEGLSFFYEPSSGGLGAGFEVREDPARSGDRRRAAKLAASRAQWQKALARLGR